MLLYVAKTESSPTEGIFKKIMAQAKAWSLVLNETLLICKQDKGAKLIIFKKGELIKEEIFVETSVLNCAIEYLNKNTIKQLYIRHMVPNFKLIKILRITKKRGIKIFYEIPTYPYYAEQIKASNNKLRTLIRLGVESFFWPIIYSYIDQLLVVISNSKTKRYKKMLEITNGIDENNVCPVKKVEDVNEISFVGIGTIFPYHGYDRLINAIEECKGYINNKKILFKIIGDSQEINRLKESVSSSKLREHYLFLGRKTTNELNQLLSSNDIGVGCLALYRRNADIDTTLKVIEYMTRGMLVLTSGFPSGQGKDSNNCIVVSNDEKKIELSEVYLTASKLMNRDIENLSKKMINKYKWENVYEKCMRKDN